MATPNPLTTAVKQMKPEVTAPTSRPTAEATAAAVYAPTEVPAMAVPNAEPANSPAKLPTMDPTSSAPSTDAVSILWSDEYISHAMTPTFSTKRDTARLEAAKPCLSAKILPSIPPLCHHTATSIQLINISSANFIDVFYVHTL